MVWPRDCRFTPWPSKNSILISTNCFSPLLNTNLAGYEPVKQFDLKFFGCTVWVVSLCASAHLSRTSSRTRTERSETREEPLRSHHAIDIYEAKGSCAGGGGDHASILKTSSFLPSFLVCVHATLKANRFHSAAQYFMANTAKRNGHGAGWYFVFEKIGSYMNK